MRTLARCLTVAISICSWVVLSNHCAFAAVTTKAPAVCGSCPFHSKPAKPTPRTPGAECCKIVRAISKPAGKIPVPAVIDVADIKAGVGEIVTPPPEVFFSATTLDTGPPGKTSFLELIQSLRAHAPPC